MSSTQPELVVFDLGRVLIRICDGWRHACETVGVPAPKLDDKTLERMAIVSHRHERGEISDRQFIEDTASLAGVLPDDVERVALGWLRGPMPDIEALIDDVLATGVQTACLSNTNAMHWAMMTGQGDNALPLAKLHHRFASHELGVMKPDAAIYDIVEARTGVAPGAILFFDDHPPNVAAARNRGWRAHRITPDRPTVEQMREHLTAAGVLPG